MDKKHTFNITSKSLGIVLACILLNYATKYLAVILHLPLWLDSIGTFFAAYCLGPVWGAIVGASGNAAFAFYNITALPYALVSMFIGVFVAFTARRGAFNRLIHAMSVAGVLTMVCGVASSVINLLLYNGLIDNIWGDGVKDFLIEKGAPRNLSVFVGQFYIEFLDKVVTVFILYLGIRILRHVRKNGFAREKKGQTTAFGILLFFLLFTLGSNAATLSVAAKEEKAPVDTESYHYVQSIYNIDSGLPCGHANAICQTKNGLLWVGTYAGLYRYDGRAFRLMDKSAPIKNVNCLYTDSDDRLWVGTNDNGLSVIRDGELLATIDSGGDLASDSIRSITQCSNSLYYVGTADSLQVMRFDEQECKFEIIETLSDPNYAFCADADSKGYVATVSGDGKLTVLKDAKAVIKKSTAKEDDGFKSVRFLRSGHLAAGTVSGKVIIYSVIGTSLKKIRTINCKGLNTLNDIFEVGKHEIFVCADNGIGRIVNKDQFHILATGEYTDAIEGMDVDYQGNLWFVSSRQGILKLSDTSFVNLFQRCGLDERVVNTSALWHNRLYVGADDGLIIIDRDTKRPVYDALTRQLEDVRIRCMQVDRKGALWICTYGSSLLRVNSDGSVKSFSRQLGERIRVCLELADGRMAVGGDKGLSYIKGDEVTRTIPYADDLGFSKILCLYQDDQGKILAGTDGNGIVVVSKKGKVESIIQRSYGLSSGVILRLVDDPISDGIFAVCSNGLNYITEDHVKYLDNFPYSNNFDIHMESDGSMFVLSSSGIYTMKRDELMNESDPEYRLLNAIMGLEGSLTANAFNAFDEKTNNLFLSTDRGVFVLNTQDYLPEDIPYRAFVERIELDGKSQISFREKGWSIPREVKKVEIYPEVVNFTLEDPTVVYWLEGFDSSKNSCRQSELSSVIYRNLPPGNYTFHMAVSDNGSKRLRAESRFAIVREKAIYDNWWFIVYLWFVPILFVGWISWFFTERHIQRTLELTQNRLELANTRLQMGNEAILAIAKLLDSKDGRTNRHSQRVAEYSVRIAQEYGFEGEELENLRKAALLHDIGKVGIPDAILNKPDRLTDEEYVIMKSHVTKGAEILEDFTMVDNVAEGARYHHERFDGKGYPDGLKGTDIPLYGRIIAVADTFDAMTANRVYRKGLDLDYVIEEFKRCRGSQFDPEFCDIFLRLLESGEIDVKQILGVDTD